MTRAGFWLAVLAYAATVGVASYALPASVPMPVGVAGPPDNLMPRDDALLTFVVVGVVLALVFAVGAELAQRVPMRLVNLPDKEWWVSTPAREARLRVMLREDVHRLGIATVWLLAALVVATILVAHQQDPQLGPWGWILLGPYLLAVLGYSGFMLAVRYRPDVP